MGQRPGDMDLEIPVTVSISVSKFQAVEATSVAAVVQHIQREHVLSYPD
jgi:hypothetical protein